MDKKYGYALIVGMALIAFLGMHAYETSALATKDLGATLKFHRLRASQADFTGGVIYDGVSGARRRINLKTLGPGDQMVSLVTNVVTPPTLTLGNGLFVERVRAAPATAPEGDSSSDLSTGDLAMPADLTWAHLENRLGNALEYAFYDENASVDIYVVFSASDGSTDLADTVGGTVDFYMTFFDN